MTKRLAKSLQTERARLVLRKVKLSAELQVIDTSIEGVENMLKSMNMPFEAPEPTEETTTAGEPDQATQEAEPA